MYNVVIIDDEPWAREVVKALGAWESLKLKITGTAEDGTEGLNLIGQLGPHIAITDMRMPGIEGVELLRLMKERFPQLKIIVMSGYDDFVYLKQAIRSKAVEYLLKPINQEELNAALEKCVKELEEDQVKINVSWSTPIAFSETLNLEKYLSFRQSITCHLFELNKTEIRNVFNEMEKFLKVVISENEDINLITKVSHDFIMILEEYTCKNEISFQNICGKGKAEWSKATNWRSISQAIEEISGLYENAINKIEELLKNRNRLNLDEVQVYIDRNYQSPVSLDTIAQHFFVSKEHLSRIFKSHTGENISAYILRKRMEKARELILEKGLEIKNVAEIIGYSDLAYFYRVFKKHFGVTPGDLRK